MKENLLFSLDREIRTLRRVTMMSIMAAFADVSVMGYLSLRFAQKEREKIYVIDGEESLVMALSQDIERNRPLEARAHVRNFHELFFSLSGDQASMKESVERALPLADRSAYDYYRDLSGRGYYSRLSGAAVTQRVIVDSVVINSDCYPWEALTYARLHIIREKSLLERHLDSRCFLRSVNRTKYNPHGFMIERFEITNNNDIRTLER